MPDHTQQTEIPHVIASSSVRFCIIIIFFLQDAKSHHWKVRFLLLNVSFCAFAGFFYWKHNMYCESGSKCDISSIFLLQSVSVVTLPNIHYIFPAGYTLFALFEYLVVFSNMAFHLTAVWDFKNREVMVISSSEEKDFWLETEGLGANCTITQPPDHDSLDPAEEEDWDGLFHISPWCRLSRPQGLKFEVKIGICSTVWSFLSTFA